MTKNNKKTNITVNTILYKKTKHKTSRILWLLYFFLLVHYSTLAMHIYVLFLYLFFCCTLIFYSHDIFYKWLCLWIFTFCLWYQSAIMSSFVYSSLNCYNNQYKNPVLWCHTKNAIFSTHQPTVITVITWLQKRLLTKLR